MAFRTTAAYLSGGMCGAIWWPTGAICGYPHRFNLRDRINRFSDPSGATFHDILLAELVEKGGDFQNAQFTADTVLRIERKCHDGPGKYRVHVWERKVAQLPDCTDLVNAEVYTSDIMGDE